MRIGMLVDIYKPHISGVTNYVVFNKRVLELAGHEVFVFTEHHPLAAIAPCGERA